MKRLNFIGLRKQGKTFEPEITRSDLLLGENNLVVTYGMFRVKGEKEIKLERK